LLSLVSDEINGTGITDSSVIPLVDCKPIPHVLAQSPVARRGLVLGKAKCQLFNQTPLFNQHHTFVSPIDFTP
jgi:hypothetical protein